MRHFWTTAAVVALCAISSPTWAAPQIEYLQLVAAKPAADAPASKTAKSKTSKSAKSKSSKSKASKSKGSKSKGSSSKHHRAKTKAERRAEARREQQQSSSNTRRRHGKSAHAAGLRGEAGTETSSRHRTKAVPSAIHTQGGGSVKVRRGETLERLSNRTGVSVAELARANGLHKPYHLKAGAYLKVPGRRYYTVKSGDTLFSLSRRFGVDEDQLRSVNGISRSRGLRAGQKLYLPGDARDTEAREAEPEPRRAPAPSRIAPESAEPESPVRTLPPPESRPLTPVPPAVVNPRPAAMPPPAGEPESGFELAPNRPAAQPVRPASPPTGADGRILPQGAPPPSAGDIVSAGRGKFLWPAAGTLLSGFGSKPDGQRNDGVNIAATTGDPVRAAADGEVVYAGDQVPSFGNLVLVKHPGGWVTAYAHMSRIVVKNRDQVTQGQQIGVVGQSGSVDRPQLHFEIRYAPSPKDKATPVDPMLLLPAR